MNIKTLVCHDQIWTCYEHDYFTDNLKRRGLKFLKNLEKNKPFFLMLATPAAHASFTPAPQVSKTHHETLFSFTHQKLSFCL